MGIEGWISFAFGTSISDHQLDVEVLPARSSRRGRRRCGGPPLIPEHGIGETHDAFSIRHGFGAACPQQLVDFHPRCCQSPKLLCPFLETLEAVLLDVSVSSPSSCQPSPQRLHFLLVGDVEADQFLLKLSRWHPWTHCRPTSRPTAPSLHRRWTD